MPDLSDMGDYYVELITDKTVVRITKPVGEVMSREEAHAIARNLHGPDLLMPYAVGTRLVSVNVMPVTVKG